MPNIRARVIINTALEELGLDHHHDHEVNTLMSRLHDHKNSKKEEEVPTLPQDNAETSSLEMEQDEVLEQPVDEPTIIYAAAVPEIAVTEKVEDPPASEVVEEQTTIVGDLPPVEVTLPPTPEPELPLEKPKKKAAKKKKVDQQ